MTRQRLMLEPSRLEAFSDGVIAVIITIMVLELKIPGGDGWSGFRSVLPTLLTYLLSFVFVGLYWINHHLLISRLKRVSTGVLWANLSWLFALSLVPFATEYLAEKKDNAFSVELYSLCMLLTAAAFLAVRYTADCVLAEAAQSGKSPAAAALRVRHLGSIGVYLIAVLIARRAPVAALLFNAAVAVVWVLPSLGVLPPAAQEMMLGEDGFEDTLDDA